MSARDAESGSSTYKGGSRSAGGLGNGGVGGGRGGGGNYGGGYGGGAARNGGINSATGLTTGKTWHGNTAFGQAGGAMRGYGMKDKFGNVGNFRNWDGSPMFTGPLAGRRPGTPSAGIPRPAGAPPTEQIVAVEDVPPPPPLPNIPRTYVPSRIQQIFDPTPWMTPQAPDPLANDMTRLVRPGAPPLNPYGVSGGLGVPGYTTPRDPNYGFGNGYGGDYGTGGGYGGNGGGGW